MLLAKKPALKRNNYAKKLYTDFIQNALYASFSKLKKRLFLFKKKYNANFLGLKQVL
jgi:hypothetical protein